MATPAPSETDEEPAPAPAPAPVHDGSISVHKYMKSPLFMDYYYRMNVTTACFASLSIAAGLAVVLAILRSKRKRLTDFDRLVLALTLWQLVYDLGYLLQEDLVGNSRSALFTVFCGPRGCRDATSLAARDDDFGPKHFLSPYAVAWDSFDFLTNWSEIGAGLCSNLLTTTVVWIVAFSRLPSWQKKYFNSIMLAIVVLSLPIPLVELVYYVNGVKQFSYKGMKDDDGLSPSDITTDDSRDFQYRLDRTMSSLQILIVTYNFVGCCVVWWFVRNSSQKARSQGRAAADSPMTEVSKRLALYPLIQLVTKLPEIRFKMQCLPDSTTSYYESSEYRVCESARWIAPATTGFWLALVWYYFQPRYGKRLRASSRTFFAGISKLLSSKKSSTATDPSTLASVPVGAGENSELSVQDLEDSELVGLISGDRNAGRELELELELKTGTEIESREGSINPMAPPALVAISKRLSPLENNDDGGGEAEGW